MSLSFTSRTFGTLPSGEIVKAYTLNGAGGLSLEAITYGGIVTRLLAPDRQGRLDDVVLGFDHLEKYLAGHPWFGAIAGRIAGRVTHGRFPLEGSVVQLACNLPPNHIHGGAVGLDKRLWQAHPLTRSDGSPSLRLTYHSPDGEENYPGAVDIAVTYTVTPDNAFIIETEATADRVTPLNLTHHSYFNLAGEAFGSSIAGHELQIYSDTAIDVDEKLTLLGKAIPVVGRPHDFNKPRRLGDAIPYLYLRHGDLYLIRRPHGAGKLARAARLSEPGTGRVLTVDTTENFFQLYTGMALDGSLTGKSGRPYHAHAGVCLECEGYPDGVGNPAFGSILLEPGVPARHTTAYTFSTC